MHSVQVLHPTPMVGVQVLNELHYEDPKIWSLFSPARFNFVAFDAHMVVVMENKRRGKEEG